MRYPDEVHGTLMLQVDRTLELLQNKSLGAQVRHEGAAPVEEQSIPSGLGYC